MKDIEQLLKMTERPQDYTDEELQKLMSDPEMREYYELMVSVESGFAERSSRKEECGRWKENILRQISHSTELPPCLSAS